MFCILFNFQTRSSMEGNTLAEVDGNHANNNKPVYATTATGVLSIPSGPLTDDDIKNLQRNTLTVGVHNVSITGLQQG